MPMLSSTHRRPGQRQSARASRRSATGGDVGGGSIERTPVHAAASDVGQRRLRWSTIDWPLVLWVGGVHAAAVAAPFFMTWSGVAICLILYYVTGSLGVCLGYHRLLTHGSFATPRIVRLFFAFLGGISGEGSALHWVANHRKHHSFSDQAGDPHTPRDGGLWSHILWMCVKRDPRELAGHVARWAPDLDRDPAMHFIDRTFLLWHAAMGIGLLAAGWLLFGPFTGVSWLLWGMAVRMVIVFHVTWLVNSATHMWGYRNYTTGDDSRNLWWVGLLAFGEGWHNNHHAFQRMAKHGHRWWEIDVTYWAILAMERLGLAWNVVHEPPARTGAPPAPMAQVPAGNAGPG
jgi:fatty-acid desaturase